MTEFGLVLAGGGAKGGYEIGVWKALRELNINIKAIAGTSVGALNGAIMTQGDYDAAYNLWTNLAMQDVINLEDLLNEDFKINTKNTAVAIKKIFNNKGLDVTPLRETLKKYIDEDLIRNSPINFALVTFSLTDFKPVMVYKKDIPQGELINYLMASSCFPSFKATEIDNKKFIDGGVYDNMPISLIENLGIENVITVDVSGVGRVRKKKYKNLNILPIKNSEYLGQTLVFDGESSKRNITIGYLDTLKAFKEVDGYSYYFKKESSTLLNKLENSELLYLMDFLGIKGKPKKNDKLIEFALLKELKKYVTEHLNSTNILYGALEITAEVLGINRLEIYTYDKLTRAILKNYNMLKSTYILSDFDILKFNIENLKNIDRKLLLVCNTTLKDYNNEIINLRRFCSVTFPKIAIANMFITLLIYRNSNESSDS